ncbi:MAG: hypothetical protein AAF821_02455 [Cyanobacteria bacterium P01_D01_bin.156]
MASHHFGAAALAKTLCYVAPLILAVVSCQATPTPDIAVEPPPETSNNATAPPPPPANSYLAQLSPEVTNQLRALDIEIVIPTYLPANTKLATYGVEAAAEPLYYWLVYRDEQNRCFAIEYAATAINSISLDNKEPISSSLFGDDYHLYHGKRSNGGGGELLISDLLTDWIKSRDGFYRLVGAGMVTGQSYGPKNCTNVTVQEAIAIAESLSYLPEDIRTLDAIPAQPNPGIEIP